MIQFNKPRSLVKRVQQCTNLERHILIDFPSLVYWDYTRLYTNFVMYPFTEHSDTMIDEKCASRHSTFKVLEQSKLLPLSTKQLPYPLNQAPDYLTLLIHTTLCTCMKAFKNTKL